MEVKNYYKNSWTHPHAFTFNEKTSQFEFATKFARLRLLEEVNDLRYKGFGLQSIYTIILFFPDHSVQKNMIRKDEKSYEKVKTYINKTLKKNGFKQINFNTDLVQFLEGEYTVDNIEKETI